MNMKKWSGAIVLGLVIILGACSNTETDIAETANSEGVTETGEVGVETPAAEPDNTTIVPDVDGDELDEPAALDIAASIAAIETSGAEFVADAQPFIQQFTPLSEGTHRLLSIGTEISFTTTEPLTIQPNGIGFAVISDPISTGPDDQDIVFIRASEFSDPTQPFVPREEQEPWPSNDFIGWLDNLPDGVITSDPIATSIGGLDATFAEIELGDIECGYAPGTCIGFAENNNVDVKALSPGSQYRVWVVDQLDEDPLVIIVGIQDPSAAAWFERADEVLQTVAFGEIAPNPIFQTRTEPTEIAALGGIEVTFPDERTFGERWRGRGFWVTPFDDFAGQADLVGAPRRVSGEAVAETDELVSVLEEFEVELTEVEPALVGGIDARVFEYTSSNPMTLVLRTSELEGTSPDLGWFPGRAGRLWVVEHPDRGLQMISAKAFENPEEQLPVAQAWAEELIASLNYVDPS